MVTAVPGLTNPRVEPVNAATPSTPLRVKRATLTFDRTWSPYIQGTMVCRAQTAAEASSTDPRQGQAVKFTLTQKVDAGAQQSLPLVAWLRSRSNDLLNDEATLTFASVEAPLRDVHAGLADALNQTDVQVVNNVLDTWRWDFTSPVPPASSVTTLDGSAAIALPNTWQDLSQAPTVWEFAQSIEESCGLWLRGDETGVALVRSQPGWAADTSTHTITGTDRILAVTDTVDRENPAFATGVYLVYKDGTDAGSAAPTGIPGKDVLVYRKTTKAKGGSATALAQRMYARGRVLTVTAIADLACRPNQTWRVQFRGYDFTGKVQAVTFRYPEGLMDLSLNV